MVMGKVVLSDRDLPFTRSEASILGGRAAVLVNTATALTALTGVRFRYRGHDTRVIYSCS